MRLFLAVALSLLVLTGAEESSAHFGRRAAPPPQSESFASFWKNFKTALAKNDKEAVASLTKLPFPYDNGELSRAQLIKRFDELFDRRLKRCLARARAVRDGESYSVFCGEQGLFFERVNGRYKFTSFFAND